MKKLIKKLLSRYGVMRHSQIPSTYCDIKDAEYYVPLFSPWLGYGDFAHYLEISRDDTLVSPDRCYVLYVLALQAMNLEGDFFECGVYKGGTAKLLAELIASKKAHEKKLHLFDTFTGMPDTIQGIDKHKRGDFSDTNIINVRNLLSHDEFVEIHQGFIPRTFEGFENVRIAFAHVDVDIYQSVLDCCRFIVPRLVPGGVLIFDDYGFPSCPGARKAVDEFFLGRQEIPLVLPTGQAVVFSPVLANLKS